jgi:hypothetical protein
MVEKSLNVVVRLRVSWHDQPAAIEHRNQTSTIWMVASFSNTAAGVNPGAW